MKVLIRGHRKLNSQYHDPHSPTVTWCYVEEQLKTALLRCREKYGEVKLIHGGAIGVDQVAAYQAVQLEIPHIWVCPFGTVEIQSLRWPGTVKTWINQVLLPSAEVVALNYPTIQRDAFQKRNVYMADMLGKDDLDICVWDGVKKGGTWNGTKYGLDLHRPGLFDAPSSFRMLRLNPYAQQDGVKAWSVLAE